MCRLTSPPLDLSAAVDVYSDWIDACDTVANENRDSQADAEALSAHPDYAFDGSQRNLDADFEHRDGTPIESGHYDLGE